MRAYYAHCIALYDTPQERRDVELLEFLRFDVLNPNSEEHQRGCKLARELAEAKGAGAAEAGAAAMDYFKLPVHSCDILVFRALPDGAIPAGVAKEIQWARDAGMPVLELPSGIARRELTVAATREYVRESGAR